jgi:hypothetical protein
MHGIGGRFKKLKTSNLFEVLIKEKFKLQLNEIFMTHYLVFKDEMELLELAQRDGVGSLVHYV